MGKQKAFKRGQRELTSYTFLEQYSTIDWSQPINPRYYIQPFKTIYFHFGQYKLQQVKTILYIYMDEDLEKK